MRRTERFLNALTVLAVAAAVLTLVTRFWPAGNPSGPSASSAQPERPVEAFPELASSLLRIGAAKPRLTIVEFGDFQCPGCARFAAVIDTLLNKHPEDVQFIWRHFPLPNHHLAYPLSRAGECAAEQGRFREFYNIAFKHQHELGLITVSQLGLRSGIRDSAAFLSCAADSAKVPAIERDLAMGHALEVRGTPTIIVNGTLYSRGSALRVADFERMLNSY